MGDLESSATKLHGPFNASSFQSFKTETSLSYTFSIVFYRLQKLFLDYLALPNRSLEFEMFSALRQHLRGNRNVRFLGNSVISNSIFIPVGREMSYFEMQHKVRYLKSF